MDYKEDQYYTKNRNEDDFYSLDDQIQNDLIEWYNVRLKSLNSEDRKRLFNLYKDFLFWAWDCPGCGKRVFNGTPESWDDFQGTLNQDFSYFGDPDKYTSNFIEALCDTCRCYGPKRR